MNSIILSPVGTSIFTKGKFPPEINKFSNCKNLEEIPSDRREEISSYIQEVKELLLSSSLEKVKERSAELNGIIRFYNDNLHNAEKDIHYLLPSDTYIGRSACEIVKSFLQNYVKDVRIMEIKDLQTYDCEGFQYALSDLVSQIMTIKEGLLSGQKLIFNLTGGFKSILCFLQSLGMFYADETVYVFEFSDSLLRIPALPVKLVPYDYLKGYITVFRRLHNGLSVTEEEYNKIPESLILKLYGEPTLSAYGKIVWDNFRKELYSEKLLDSISPKVKYSESFRKSTKNLEKDRFYNLNMRIDEVSCFMEKENKPNLASLDLKKLEIPKGISTHEFDAWADKDAKRVFCHFEKDTLVLDTLLEGLH